MATEQLTPETTEQLTPEMQKQQEEEQPEVLAQAVRKARSTLSRRHSKQDSRQVPVRP